MGQGEVQVHRSDAGEVVFVVDGSAGHCDGWHQDQTQQQTMEQCSLSLGLDQGIVEDEDVSVEADAGVDESVDESEKENNESEEAEDVGVYKLDIKILGITFRHPPPFLSLLISRSSPTDPKRPGMGGETVL